MQNHDMRLAYRINRYDDNQIEVDTIRSREHVYMTGNHPAQVDRLNDFATV
jgi:hypothetical protein